MDDEVLLELDSRRRVALSGLCGPDDRYFLASRRADGALVLRPAEVRPKVVADLDRVSPGWREQVTDDLAAGLPTADAATWQELRSDVTS